MEDGWKSTCKEKDFVDCNESYIVIIPQNNTMNLNNNKTKKLAEGVKVVWDLQVVNNLGILHWTSGSYKSY